MMWYEYSEGKIVARYENEHPGLVQLPSDHPDVIEFLARLTFRSAEPEEE